MYVRFGFPALSGTIKRVNLFVCVCIYIYFIYLCRSNALSDEIFMEVGADITTKIVVKTEFRPTTLSERIHRLPKTRYKSSEHIENNENFSPK